jgi:hypothetical protein
MCLPKTYDYYLICRSMIEGYCLLSYASDDKENCSNAWMLRYDRLLWTE